MQDDMVAGASPRVPGSAFCGPTKYRQFPGQSVRQFRGQFTQLRQAVSAEDSARSSRCLLRHWNAYSWSRVKCRLKAFSGPTKPCAQSPPTGPNPATGPGFPLHTSQAIREDASCATHHQQPPWRQSAAPSDRALTLCAADSPRRPCPNPAVAGWFCLGKRHPDGC